MKLPDPRKEMLLSEIQTSASRSSGPGGQNVNKVNTQIELRFSVVTSDALSESEKELILSRLKNRINNNGILFITASAERSQWKNRKLAENKFINLIENALSIPKRRKKTKPTKSSIQRRIENKKKLSLRKELRKPPGI